ncbi:MAG: hypothetical protein ABEL51_14935 [Salinibacter sp.]
MPPPKEEQVGHEIQGRGQKDQEKKPKDQGPDPGKPPPVGHEFQYLLLVDPPKLLLQRLLGRVGHHPDHRTQLVLNLPLHLLAPLLNRGLQFVRGLLTDVLREVARGLLYAFHGNE